MVPLVRLERTLLAELDFESSASTNSTTGACPGLPKSGKYRNAALLAICSHSGNDFPECTLYCQNDTG